METKRTILKKSETSSEIDLFSDLDLTKSQKKEIQSQVGEFLVEQTAIAVSSLKSPVDGGEFVSKLTSKEYKKKKLDEVGSSEPNLEFSGRMLDQLTYEPTSSGIKIGIFGDRAPAADGHNNLSGDSKLPRRQFLPEQGQDYKSDIKKEVERIIADVIAETSDIQKSAFEGVETKSDLYTRLGALLNLSSRAEIKLAVIRNVDLLEMLDGLELSDLL